MTIRSKIFSVFLVAFIGAALLRTFVLEGFIVIGDSMEPTIHSGDYVFINKLAYARGEPERGDIIVAKTRGDDKRIVKRVIGLPGERVFIEENGLTTSEKSSTTAISINIDPEEYYVLGDNRTVSVDSREVGAIDKWDIKGKVFGAFNLKTFKFRGL